MRIAQAFAAALTGLMLTGGAHAEQPAAGIVAPLSGPSELLGKQILTGATLAAGKQASLTVADDACTAEGGANAARMLVQAGVKVAIGFLCIESIDAAAPILKEAGIPIIAIGVRADSLTDQRARSGWPVFRLGPRGDGERNAVASILTRLWKDQHFAIVDDGTIYGRELAETLRAQAEQAALKPVFTDTFRPGLDNQIALVGRLRRAGATHVFVGGEAEDVAIMARDAAGLDAGITFAGGEALRAAFADVPLAAGTLEVADPQMIEAFNAAGVLAEGYALPAYAAVQIAEQAAASGKPLADALSQQAFSTAIGQIRFDEKGDLTESPYRLFRFDGQRFVEQEVP
jgi:branched-chain amino acid transport system substrate-binding protein